MKILLFPNLYKDLDLSLTKRVSEYLLTKKAELFIVPQGIETETLPDNIKIWDKNEKCDVIIVLGGDGSILKAVQIAYESETPILGINLGKIGYMADIDMQSLFLLDKLFTGDYTIENRMMLCGTINKNGEKRTFYALNDLVVANGSVSRMVNLSLDCDNNVFTYSCDGIIAATPTGSTAYSMSAGGSIVDPRLDCILITPICSHSLSTKQLVFSPECEIKITNENNGEKLVYLTVDGGENVQIGSGDSVLIKRAEKKTGLIKLTDNSFTATLSEKMKKRSL